MRRDSKILRCLGWNVQGDLGPWTFYTSARKHLVIFLKAPPLVPPSNMQVHQRNAFRQAGHLWCSLLPIQRAAWERVSKVAGLSITGYNLFVHLQIKKDPSYVHTLEHQSGLRLLPLTVEL